MFNLFFYNSSRSPSKFLSHNKARKLNSKIKSTYSIKTYITMADINKNTMENAH